MAHQTDVIEADGETSEEAVQFAAPMKLEAIPVLNEGASVAGLTLDTIE